MKERELINYMIFKFFEEINMFNWTHLYSFQITFSGNSNFEDSENLKIRSMWQESNYFKSLYFEVILPGLIAQKSDAKNESKAKHFFSVADLFTNL